MMFGIILYNGRKVFVAGTKAPQVLGDRPVSGKTGMTGKHILLFLFRMEKVFYFLLKISMERNLGELVNYLRPCLGKA